MGKKEEEERQRRNAKGYVVGSSRGEAINKQAGEGSKRGKGENK